MTSVSTAPARLVDAPASPPAGTASEGAAFLVPVGLVLALVSHYPGWVDRRSSLGQYFTGVYRSRVLARELILGIANGVDRVVGAHGNGPSPGFVVGWVTVTGGGFLVAWWLLHRYVRNRAPAFGPLELVIAAVMAASATVLTPYDFLSYALIIATVVVAGAGRTIATAGLAAAAVATRESGFLAVAIIACCAGMENAVGDGRGPGGSAAWRVAARHRPLWAAAGAASATYTVLKIMMRHGRGLTLFQHVGLRANLTPGSVWAVALAAASLAAGRWAAGPARAAVRTRRRVLWLAALPYLVVVAIGSNWQEAPRLVMPLVLGEAVLAVTAAARPNAELPQPKASNSSVAWHR
jgi:hypothetical protein